MRTESKITPLDVQGNMRYLKTNYVRKETPFQISKPNLDLPEKQKLSHNKNSQKKCLGRTAVNVLEDYFSHSTIQGFKYIGNNTLSYGERVLWLLLTIVCITSAIWYAYELYQHYYLHPVVIRINPSSTQISEIPFPAITICNMNVVKKQEAERILKDGTLTERNFLNDACEMETTIIAANAVENETSNWENILKFISRISQPCEEMLKVCRWRLNDVDCSEIFTPIITDEGLCCTFNMLPVDRILRDSKDFLNINATFNKYQVDEWNPERGYAPNTPFDVFPFRCTGAGAHLGLTLVLDAAIDDYYCSSGNSVGFRLLMHNPTEIPTMTDFAFMAPPGIEERYTFHTISSDARESLRSVDVVERQCFFNDEKYLKFFRIYSKSNCQMECLSNLTLERCGCVPYHLPKMLELEELSTDEKKRCNCLPACFQLSYEKYPSYGILTNSLRMKNRILRNVSATYFKNNMAIMQFYLPHPQFVKYSRDLHHEFPEFIANVGGLLGLFLGFSVLCIVEVFYYLTLKPFCNNYRTRKQAGRKQRSSIWHSKTDTWGQ